MKGIDLKVYGTAPNGALLVSADEVNSGVQAIIDENARLQQHNAELESMMVEVNNNRTGVSPCARFCEALATKKMFDNLQRERDELAAQVEQLRNAAQAFSFSFAHDDEAKDIAESTLCRFADLQDCIAKTPAQCLAEVKAQAVEKFGEHLIWDRLFSKSEVRNAAAAFKVEIKSGEVEL